MIDFTCAISGNGLIVISEKWSFNTPTKATLVYDAKRWIDRLTHPLTIQNESSSRSGATSADIYDVTYIALLQPESMFVEKIWLSSMFEMINFRFRWSNSRVNQSVDPSFTSIVML